MDSKKDISSGFQAFSTEAPEQAGAWMKMVQTLSGSSALDAKTHNIAYISVLSALGRVNGIPFRVKAAKRLGATRDEIISAVLVGLPPAGHVVTEALPAALAAYDDE